MKEKFTTEHVDDKPDFMILVKDDPVTQSAAIDVVLENKPGGVSKLAQACGGVVFAAATQIYDAGKTCHVGCAILAIIDLLLEHMVAAHPEVAKEYYKAAYAKLQEGQGAGVAAILKEIKAGFEAEAKAMGPERNLTGGPEGLPSDKVVAETREWCACKEHSVCMGYNNCRRRAN